MKYALTLEPNTTFDDAIIALDRGGIGYLALVDDQRRLLGILTDGDIRRAILNRKTDLREIMNTSPKTADYRLPKRQVVQLLKDFHRKHMPLVDENNVYHGLLALDDLEFNAKPNRVVIMAGGFGKRLGDLTRDIPKPMLRVGKKSMLENLIDVFSDHGFSKFYISVHYKSEVIKNYFGDGRSFGVEIEYLEEQEPLGTAGCLGLIPEKLNYPLVVINGDILASVDFTDLLDYHNLNCADATMCVRKYDYQVPYGVVNCRNKKIISIDEKPVKSFYINTGIYVMSPKIIEYVPKKQSINMTDLFEDIINKKNKVYYYDLLDYWIDIGTPQNLEKAKNDII